MRFTTAGTNCVGAFFGVPEAPCLSAVPLGAARFTVTRLDTAGRDGQTTEVSLPAADAYFVMLYRDGATHANVRSDGSHTALRDYPAGSICLVDLCDGAAISLRGRLMALAFVLPKALLAEVSDLAPETDAPGHLRCMRGARDPVVASLSRAFEPLFDGSGGSGVLLRHLAVAICAHLLHAYGEGPTPTFGRHVQ